MARRARCAAARGPGPPAVLRLEPQPEQDHLAAPRAGADRAGRRAAGPHRGAGRGVGERVPRPRRAADVRARCRARGVRAARRLAGHPRAGRGARPLRGARRPLPPGPAGHRVRCTPTTACGSRRRGATSGCRRSAGHCSSTGARCAAPTSARPRRSSSTACRRRTTACPPPPCTAHRTPTTGPPRCSSTGRCNRASRRGRCSRGTRSALRGAPPSPDACATPASATPRCSPTASARAPGWVVDVRDPAVLLRRLDRYEGTGVPADPGGRHARRRAADRLLDVRVGRRPGLVDPAAPRLDRVIEVSQHETPVTVGAP